MIKINRTISDDDKSIIDEINLIVRKYRLFFKIQRPCPYFHSKGCRVPRRSKCKFSHENLNVLLNTARSCEYVERKKK